MKLNDLPGNTPKNTRVGNERITVLTRPIGPIWDAIEAEYPNISTEEKAVMWAVIDHYRKFQDWPPYEGVASIAMSGYTVKCPHCSETFQYRPPFGSRKQVHDAIFELIINGRVRCEIESVEQCSETLLQEPDFQPKIILVPRNQELIDAVLSDFRGDTVR